MREVSVIAHVSGRRLNSLDAGNLSGEIVQDPPARFGSVLRHHEKNAKAPWQPPDAEDEVNALQELVAVLAEGPVDELRYALRFFLAPGNEIQCRKE